MWQSCAQTYGNPTRKLHVRGAHSLQIQKLRAEVIPHKATGIVIVGVWRFVWHPRRLGHLSAIMQSERGQHEAPVCLTHGTGT